MAETLQPNSNLFVTSPAVPMGEMVFLLEHLTLAIRDMTVSIDKMRRQMEISDLRKPRS